MNEFIAALIGLAIGYGLSRVTKTPSTAAPLAHQHPQPPAEGTPTTEGASADPREHLYRIAAELWDFLNQSAHPRDILGHELFRHGVDLYCIYELSQTFMCFLMLMPPIYLHKVQPKMQLVR